MHKIVLRKASHNFKQFQNKDKEQILIQDWRKILDYLNHVQQYNKQYTMSQCTYILDYLNHVQQYNKQYTMSQCTDIIIKKLIFSYLKI